MREPGEYAVRGGIVDLFPPGIEQPVRLDFFGDTLESIRSFDPETQRTRWTCARARSRAGGEVQLTHRDHPRFRRATSQLFGARTATIRSTRRSAKAGAIPAWSTGCRCSTSGSTRCSTICRRCAVVLELRREDAAPSASRRSRDYYERGARRMATRGGGAPYKPLPPDRLYLTDDRMAQRLADACRWRG